jgi:hypothetical protein
MDQPETATMEVLVVVGLPYLETQTSERAWEQDILNAVSAAIHADKTLDTLAVRPLEYEDCEWVLDCGMPMPNYGVTVGQDGSWYSGLTFPPNSPKARGQDLQSLFDYLVASGLVKK